LALISMLLATPLNTIACRYSISREKSIASDLM
jgi:hypothetical protein